MKSASTVIALAATLLPVIFASPLNLERDADVEVEYKVVTDVQVVTAYATAYATEGQAAPTTSEAPAYVAPAPEPTTTTVTKGNGRKYGWRKTKTTTTTPPPPPPEPTTSSTPPPPPPPPTTTSTPEPAPEPTTTEAPAPPPSPSSVAPVATTASAVYEAPPTAYTPAQVEPTADTGDDSYSDSNLQAAILKVSNQYRSEFQASPFTWNQSLTDMAYKSAQLCDFEHSNAGQNLAAGYSGPGGAVQGWGDEYKSFDFSNPDFSETCCHFTQLVWQDSTTVGCAAKKCPTDGSTPARGWYLICNYFPVGNMLGEFKENVKTKTS